MVANAIADVNVLEDAADTTIDLSNLFNDVDDDNMSITKTVVSSDPSLVTATANGNILTLNYQPEQNGTATVTVTGTSNGQTIDDTFTVAITNVNDPPVVTNAIEDVNVIEDAADTTIDLSNLFNDVDDDNISITKTAVSSDPSLVTVSVSGDTLTLDYQPDQNGTATVTVTGNSNGQTADDTFTVVITNVNDPPVVANPISNINVNEDAADKTIDLSNIFNDVDDDNASITKSAVSSDASLVAASVTGNTLTLSFQPNQFGTATITLTGTSNGHTVDQAFMVTVTVANDPPVVANPVADVNVLEDAADTTIDLSNLFNDVDNDNVFITKTAVSSDPSLVTVSVSGDTLTLDYQPEQNGTATITVTGTSNGQTADDIFTVTVTSVDDPPVVANAITDVNVLEDGADTTIDLSNLFNDVDDDNASITKTAVSSAPSLITTKVNGNILTLDYQPDQNGTATVTVTGTSNGQTVDHTFSATMTSVDDPPVVIKAIADLTVMENAPNTVTNLANVFNDIDDNNASIIKTLQANSEPGLVTATIAGNDLTLDFQPNRFGSSTITLLASSNGKTVEESFEVNVSPVDDAPEVINGIVDVSVEEDAFDFIVSLANVFNDIDDDNASIVKTLQTNSNPDLVTATIAGNDLTLNFQADSFGSTTIIVRATSNGKIIEDSFEVNVTPVDDGPEVSIGVVDVSVEEDANDLVVSLANVFNDVDDDNASIGKTLQANSDPSLVTATIAGNELNLDFQPNRFGSSTITVLASSNGKTVEESFELNVSPVDDAPEVINGIADVSVEEDASDFIVSLANVFNDIDDDNASIVKTLQANSNPGLVTATIEGDDLTLDFKADQFGSTTIMVRAISNGLNVEDSFDVNVSPIDDPPVVLNPIADLVSLNTGPNITINLFNVFNDVDDDNASIQKAVISGNPSLVTTSIDADILTLDFQADANDSTTVTVTATSNGQAVDAVFNVGVFEPNAPPVTANPIADVEVMEDAPDRTIDLAQVFDDPDDDRHHIKTALSSSPSLVIVTVLDDALTLNFQPNSFGTATVVVTGNSRGQTVDDVFMVTVAPVDDPPAVVNTILDVFADEDDPDYVLSLMNVFNDVDDDNTSILKISTSQHQSRTGHRDHRGRRAHPRLPTEPVRVFTQITVRGQLRTERSVEDLLRGERFAPVDDAPRGAQRHSRRFRRRGCRQCHHFPFKRI